MTPTELITLQRSFASTLQIANKARETVPFVLNNHQMSYFAKQSPRDIILKSRQLGFSRALLGQKVLKCISVRNTNAVVISHDASSTIKLFAQVHFYLKHLAFEVPTGKKSANEITFPETDSTFYIGTAGAREFGRGDTISDLHCSEEAFWEFPERILVGLMQALTPTSQVTMESTANGVGNDFHRRCLSALHHKGEFILHFYPWYIADEYVKVPPLDFEYNDEEKYYLDRVYKATDVELSQGQMFWRRCKMADDLSENRTLGISVEQYFDQEYPYDFKSSFRQSGSGIFTSLCLSPPPSFPSPSAISDLLTVYKPLHPGHEYVVGVDPAEGLFQDQSVMQVVDANTNEQVAVWCSDLVPPDELAYEIEKVGMYYNEAYVVVERNNHGLTTLSHLKHIYPINLLYAQRRFGSKAWMDEEQMLLGLRTHLNKAKIVDDLYRVLKSGFTIYEQETIDELDAFIEIRTAGKAIKYGAQEGSRDDRVMALALAVQGVNTMYRKLERKPMMKRSGNCVLSVVERLRSRPKRRDLYNGQAYM